MRLFKALIISLLVYALFLWLFVTYFSNFEKPSPKLNNHVIKIDIRDIPLTVKPKLPASLAKAPLVSVLPKKKEITKPKAVLKEKPIVKPKPKKKIAKKKVVKKKVKKKVVKKKIVKKKPLKKKIVKKKVVKKKIPKKKIIVKKKPIEKEPIMIQEPIMEEVYIFEPIVEEKSQKLQEFESEMIYIAEPMIQPQPHAQPKDQPDDLSSFFSAPSTPISPWSYPNNKIRKMYGASFHEFTSTQKKFIKNNLDTIQEITQRTLTRRGYPEGAGRTGQQGTNVVSFNLHPNGNISGLRLKTRIGYRALDENTLSLIRVAYMDYPYPSTTTKIIFYVTYSIYGY